MPLNDEDRGRGMLVEVEPINRHNNFRPGNPLKRFGSHPLNGKCANESLRV